MYEHKNDTTDVEVKTIHQMNDFERHITETSILALTKLMLSKPHISKVTLGIKQSEFEFTQGAAESAKTLIVTAIINKHRFYIKSVWKQDKYAKLQKLKRHNLTSIKVNNLTYVTDMIYSADYSRKVKLSFDELMDIDRTIQHREARRKLIQSCIGWVISR